MLLLPFTPGRMALLAVPMAALIALSYWVNPEAWHSAAWWVYASLCAFFFLVLVMPFVLKQRAWLKLDHEGMNVHLLLREESYRWHDIESFTTIVLQHGPAPMARMVGITFRGKPPRLPAWLAPVMQRVNGYHRSVPAWFGELNAAELHALLEQWRQTNLARP
jgi:hypothetical protein